MTKESSNSPSQSSAGADVRALQILQRHLGYQFKDQSLLLQALTHKSFAKQNNERLEFLGDAVLGYLVGHMVYLEYEGLREDALSLMRSQLVRGETLAGVARQIHLADCLRIGAGEKRSGGRQRDSILADAFEAVIGAMQLDGGIDVCAACVQSLFHTPMLKLKDQDLRDAKTRLQEWLQGRKLKLPAYSIESTEGASHAMVYTVLCRVDQLGVQDRGVAGSRRAAEKIAAANVLAQLQSQHEPHYE